MRFAIACARIDTANAYNLGHSEKIIGDFRQGKRDRTVISSRW